MIVMIRTWNIFHHEFLAVDFFYAINGVSIIVSFNGKYTCLALIVTLLRNNCVVLNKTSVTV